MNKPTSQQLVNAFKSKKYRLKDKPYEINIIGIRNSESQSNSFDDFVGVLFKDVLGNWMSKLYKATTDPGVYYRENPINVEGTIIMVATQHLDCYKIGKHTGYKAVEQIAPMLYIRDNDKNGLLDFLKKLVTSKTVKQLSKTNIHRANPNRESIQVDKWSAGCQVIASPSEFAVFMADLDSSITFYKHENLFDYTLFESNDFK
ncbi:MAG: hypothetical protein EKK61_03970 [Rickettsiales bacterium]|nr:MAG: hypothetical protein EKK61_03970 [Rickettsiales bacterium]